MATLDNTEKVATLVDQVLHFEYEAQHFGFHPRTFSDIGGKMAELTTNETPLKIHKRMNWENKRSIFTSATCFDFVYNIFFENTSTILTGMQEHMIKEYEEDIPLSVIKTQNDNFFLKLVKQCNKCIDKLEVFLNLEVFYVERNVVFPEDQVHITNPCTKEEDEKLDAEIEELKKNILIEKARKFSLKEKIKEQKEVKDKLLVLESDLRYMLQIVYQENVTAEDVETFYAHLKKLLQTNSHPKVMPVAMID